MEPIYVMEWRSFTVDPRRRAMECRMDTRTHESRRQALPVSSVADSYRESTKSLSEVLKRANKLIVYNNTAHRRSFRVDAKFISGNCAKPHKQCRTGWLKSLESEQLGHFGPFFEGQEPEKQGRQRDLAN